MATMTHRFAVGDHVLAQDDVDYRPAAITALSPYRGRPGYYVAWADQIDRPMDHHSKGGWKPETAIAALSNQNTKGEAT
jgi:hypothetical protein